MVTSPLASREITVEPSLCNWVTSVGDFSSSQQHQHQRPFVCVCVLPFFRNRFICLFVCLSERATAWLLLLSRAPALAQVSLIGSNNIN